MLQKSISHIKKLPYLQIFIILGLLWSLLHHGQFNWSLIQVFFYDPWMMLSIIGLCYLIALGNSWRWYLLNQMQNIPLSFLRSLILTYHSSALNCILPGGSGDLGRIYQTIKYFPSQKSAIVLAAFMDRIISTLGILLIACFCTAFYFNCLQQNNSLLHFMAICLGFFMALIGTVTFLFYNKKCVRLCNKYHHYSKFRTALKTIQTSDAPKKIILYAIFISIVNQMLLVLAILIISKVMNFPTIPVLDYTFAMVIGQIASYIPLTPGGIGVGEVAFANTLILLNPEILASYATIFFTFRLMNLVAYLPGMIIGFSIFKKNTPDTTIEALHSDS
ncbi:MAG: flippase-like domain-containing protein [Gammaproteobacteria bacterium]|nr:flippase-like domain-containing protein [Gammaproteobacteria bacterium]